MLVRKGARVRAAWLEANAASLAGVQAKVGATARRVTGVVRHLRGDSPAAPALVRIFITPEDWDGPFCRPPGCACAEGHVAVDPAHIEAVEIAGEWRPVPLP